jgi:CheY-like chemotaxis protein
VPPTLVGSETVLVVEDEPELSRIAGRMLSSAGYRVLYAANGAEALALCSEPSNRIDLMFTDVVMPQMGGRELAARAAIERPDLKVLYMSGYTRDTAQQGDLDAGMRLLEKPFSTAELLRKVREALATGGQGDETLESG